MEICVIISQDHGNYNMSLAIVYRNFLTISRSAG